MDIIDIKTVTEIKKVAFADYKKRRLWDIICEMETGSVEELDQMIEELGQGGFIELEYAMMYRKDSLEESICEK